MCDEYPYKEHAKMKQLRPKIEVATELLEWLQQKGVVLCRLSGNHYMPTRQPIQNTLAAFFDIDQNKIEAEKEAMLEEVRRRNREAQDEARKT